MRIYIVGMGPGQEALLTGEARAAVQAAEVIIGAQRLLDALPAGCTPLRYANFQVDDIMELIGRHGSAESICVLMSGDVGFYSGARRLLGPLAPYEVHLIPGISSLQYFAARLGRPWQDWKLASAHGTDCDAAGLVWDHAATFFLTGGVGTVRTLCARLDEAGLGDCGVTVGEDLGSARERIKSDTAARFSQSDHEPLSVMLVDNPTPRRKVSGGLPDEVFLRGDIPMTKSEVRSVILSKLRLGEADTIYDIGAGTGSVSVEAALTARSGRVYAIERQPEGCRLIQENAKKLGAFNLVCIQGEAPAALAGLPPPDAAFIGGSGGHLTEILAELLRINPKVRMVISAVTLETLREATAACQALALGEVETVQIAVSKARPLGGHHLLMAQNPVFIISGVGENG